MLIFAVGLSSKNAVVTLVIFSVTGPLSVKFAQDVAKVLLFNIYKAELQYSNPFRNASVLNEGHFANFAQNWLS